MLRERLMGLSTHEQKQLTKLKALMELAEDRVATNWRNQST